MQHEQKNITDLEMQYGRSITAAGDSLHPVSLSRLFIGISRPRQEFKDQVTRLRAVKAFSPDTYKQLKKQLPYFVCGSFHPKIRRREHFVSIRCFVLDLDHLSAAEVNKERLSEKLGGIDTVKMIFTSPGDDGLKILFLLSKACTDSALFSSFYKLFAARFAAQYNLEEVIDIKTSDVTRACFMSYDANAYYAENAVPIDMSAYVSQNDFASAAKEIKSAEKENPRLKPKKPSAAPSADTLQKIKEKLNPNFKSPKKKSYFVPPQVEEAMELLREKLAGFGIELKETDSISYGRKLKLSADNLWAEINLFYGKKGYSVVRTPKSGSNEDLGILAKRVIEEILFTRQEKED